LHDNWALVKEYPLSKELLALSHVWQSPNKKDFIVASKGAPEAILNLCHVNKEKKAEIMQRVKEISEKGLRILGSAKAVFSSDNLPKNQHDFNFEFVGLFGFIDPARSTADDAIREAYSAGIRVIMITGDYPGTAKFIAKKIGIKNPEEFITGEELEKIAPLDLREKIKTVNIFARVVPEQKLMIVNALKANHEIVAMTGDGVNDAPALKAAHIGIAMGERGTDVAREASSLVLLNDDFSSIVAAVRLGRRIFDNLKRVMGYIVAVHVPIAGMAILPLIFDFPIVLLPAHIAFLELIIDPACSIVFESEKEEKNVMNRPPRNLKSPLFGRETFFTSLVQGLSILAVVFIVFLLSIDKGASHDQARSLAFISLVLTNLLLIVTNLSQLNHFIDILKEKNKALYWVIGSTIMFLTIVFYLPFFRNLFHFTNLHLNDVIMAVGIALFSMIWFEGIKVLKNKN
jgi:Ca2+-transporting ATPase